MAAATTKADLAPHGRSGGVAIDDRPSAFAFSARRGPRRSDAGRGRTARDRPRPGRSCGKATRSPCSPTARPSSAQASRPPASFCRLRPRPRWRTPVSPAPRLRSGPTARPATCEVMIIEEGAVGGFSSTVALRATQLGARRCSTAASNSRHGSRPDVFIDQDCQHDVACKAGLGLGHRDPGCSRRSTDAPTKQ